MCSHDLIISCYSLVFRDMVGGIITARHSSEISIIDISADIQNDYPLMTWMSTCMCESVNSSIQETCHTPRRRYESLPVYVYNHYNCFNRLKNNFN